MTFDVLRLGRGLAILTVLALLASLLLAGTAVARPVQPSQKSSTSWAWLTDQNPNDVHTYTPAAVDQGNSSGGTNTVKYKGTGRYYVTMAGVGATGGVVNVTPLGSAARLCNMSGWGAVGADEYAYVQCSKLNGALAASRFVVTFLAASGDAGNLAYLLLDSPTATNSTPDATWSYNSTGGINTAHRISAGRYVFTLPNVGSNHGNVIVTAYYRLGQRGVDSAAPATATTYMSICSVFSWGGSPNLSVTVDCDDPSGAPIDTAVNLIYTLDAGLKGFGGQRVAYLWADEKSAATYTPDTNYQYSSAASSAQITRQGPGRYTVTLAGMPKGGAAEVATYGFPNRACQVGSIRTSGTPQMIQVLCFDLAGHPKDAQYTLAYER